LLDDFVENGNCKLSLGYFSDIPVEEFKGKLEEVCKGAR